MLSNEEVCALYASHTCQYVDRQVLALIDRDLLGRKEFFSPVYARYDILLSVREENHPLYMRQQF